MGGDGVEKDACKAREWFEKAAGQGQNEAMFWLGYMYYYGCSVNEDKQEAAKWYEKAAEYYEKAADQDMEEAQLKLGFMHENGYGVEQNYQKAKECYEKLNKESESINMYGICSICRQRIIAINGCI